MKANDNIANHHYIKITMKEMRMMETSMYQLFTLNGDQLMIQNRKKDGLITTVMDLDAHIPDKTFEFLILINRDPSNSNYHRDAR